METREYRNVDKSAWKRGEWDSEPDKAQFTDAATGLPCLIVRGPAGALCGYVGVASGHSMFQRDYSYLDVDVHGGLTFASFCADTQDESRHICHAPEPGEPDHVWWFGFDCAHSGDVCPSYNHEPLSYYETYKPIGYVRSQCAKLAQQLAALA